MEFACSVQSPNASQTQQKPWPSTLSALTEKQNINRYLLALIIPSSRPGGGGGTAMSPIKASVTEKCQREFLILISKLHPKCCLYNLLLLSRYGLGPGHRNFYTKFGSPKPTHML